MKRVSQLTLTLTAITAAVQWCATATGQVYSVGGNFGVGGEYRSVLTIKSDGSCVWVAETVESRTLAEQAIQMRERFEKMEEAADQGEGGTPAQTDQSSTNAAPPLTDAELTRKITETLNERTDESAEDSGGKTTVEVKKDTVLTTVTRSFTSLAEMLKESRSIWNRSGVMFENARFETDTNGLLRVTLTPQKGMERYLKNFRSEWKLSGAKSELKMVFPGKVISSGLPGMQTNSTWLAVDANRDESLDAVAKLYAAPTIIIAEPGGLKWDHPLESKSLQRSSRQRGEAGEDLPITSAGPGFLAEAQSVTTTALHVFPGGEDYFKENNAVATGAVVNAKLYAPKGRTLLSASDIRVLKAVDDKGRSVVTETEPGEDVQSGFSYSNSGLSADANSLQVQLRLQLPRPDAQAIDEISAEAVVVTAGGWKEMTLTNLQENATNELDLAGVLPGAKMVVTKLSRKNGQFSLQARLHGPRTVRGLDVRAKIHGNDEFTSYSYERRFDLKAGEANRTLTIQGYGLGSQDVSSQASVVLIVRCPEDLRREHVTFKLKGLDLL